MRSVDLINALSDSLGQRSGRAGARVIKNQNVHLDAAFGGAGRDTRCALAIIDAMRWNLTPWLDRYSWLKRAHDVAIFAQRRARDVRMAQVAGSLTFTTILTIVPLFAVALALFTAFPLFVEVRGSVENAVLKALPGQISDTVLRYINEFALKATRLTAVGLIFLAVTAIAMMVTFDRVMNDIWRVKNRRPLTQRVLIYWAILTLGPLLIGASLISMPIASTMSRSIM